MYYVTRPELMFELERIYREIHRMADATQVDIDALTGQIGQVQTDLAATQGQLQSEIDKLSTANPGVDVSALQSAVSLLDPAVVALGNIIPTPAAPPANTTPGAPPAV